MTNLNTKYYIIKYNDAPKLNSGDLLNLNEKFDSYLTIKDAENKIKQYRKVHGPKIKRKDFTIMEVNVNVKELK